MGEGRGSNRTLKVPGTPSRNDSKVEALTR